MGRCRFGECLQGRHGPIGRFLPLDKEGQESYKIKLSCPVLKYKLGFLFKKWFLKITIELRSEIYSQPNSAGFLVEKYF